MSKELTKQQQNVYNAICVDGITEFQDLMDLFCVSKSTIKSHLVSIFKKKNIKNIKQMIYRHYAEKE